MKKGLWSLFVISFSIVGALLFLPNLSNAATSEVAIDPSIGWTIDEYVTDSGLPVDGFLVQGHESTAINQRMAILNFMNLGNSRFTATKVIPMKKGKTYSLDLVYANYFSSTTTGAPVQPTVGYIDFNGTKTVASNSPAEEFYTETVIPTADMDYTITMHFEINRGINGYMKVGYDKKGLGITEITPQGKVTVSYVDQAGNMIGTVDTLEGDVGTPYQTNAKIISGYTLVESPVNATGNYTELDQTVVYKYQKDQVKTSSVTVHHVDEMGNDLTSVEVLTGEVGTAYETKSKTIDGYTLKETPENAIGIYEPQDKEVVYVYSLTPIIPALEGSVTVRYVDESGNELAPAEKLIGEIDSAYATKAKTIKGYTLKETPKNATGNFKKEAQEVLYLYKKEAPSVTTEKPKPDTTKPTPSKEKPSVQVNPDSKVTTSKAANTSKTKDLPQTSEAKMGLLVSSGFLSLLFSGFIWFTKIKQH